MTTMADDDYPGDIYLLNKSSGEVHREDAAGRSHETCNLDDLLPEHRQELSKAEALRIVAAHPERACGNCWPADEAKNVVPI